MRDSTAQRTIREATTSTAVLAHLLDLCRDGVHGYVHAAHLTRDPDVRELLGRLHVERQSCVLELEDLLEKRGARVDPHGTARGALHAPWLEVRARLARGPRALLAECARGDAVAIQAYRLAIEALDDQEILSVVGEQFARICDAHDKVVARLDTEA